MNNILNGKVVLAAMVIAVVLSAAGIVYIVLGRPTATQTSSSLASGMTVIRAPTSTPRPLPPTLTPIPPTLTPTPTLAPGQIGIGAYVQPATGGVGLRVHTDPKLVATAFTAFDSEVFLVTSGPVQGDGYTWWHLTASYDTKRAGWAVQDYLIAIPKP